MSELTSMTDLQPLVSLLRKYVPETIAKEMNSVHDPLVEMFGRLIKEIASQPAKSETELRAEGYRPVHPEGVSLLWVKDENVQS